MSLSDLANPIVQVGLYYGFLIGSILTVGFSIWYYTLRTKTKRAC